MSNISYSKSSIIVYHIYHDWRLEWLNVSFEVFFLLARVQEKENFQIAYYWQISLFEVHTFLAIFKY